jgi:hypothetical protein
VRIRWRGVARVAAIVLVALIGVRLLPGLLRAPVPPPLGRDVGLPKAKPVAASRPVVRESIRAVPEPAGPKTVRRRRSKIVPDAPAATAKLGTRTRHRRHPHPPPSPDRPTPEPRSEPVETTPPPAPEYVPAPAPEATSEPLPEPPPTPRSTPGDGGQEFAPR